LQSALQELQFVDLYQYVVENDNLDQAVNRVSAIIDAEVVSRQRVAGLRHQVSQLVQRLEAEIHA
jgi:guanylate kinase